MALIFAIIVTPRFGLIAVIAGFITLYLFKKLNKFVKLMSEQATQENSIFSSIVIEFFSSFKYILATSRQDNFTSVANQSAKRFSKIQALTGVASAFTNSIKEPVAVILILTIIYLEVVYFSTPLSALLVSTIFFYKSYTAVVGIQSTWQSCLEGAGAVSLVEKELIATANQKEKTGTRVTSSLSTQIDFENVSFNYDGNEKAGLFDVSLSIPTKKMVAIIGQSGSGKTTIADLITLVHRPNRGEIFINGISSEHIDKKTWREKIGYVSQEPFILEQSIINNIVFDQNLFKSKISDNFEEVKAVCELVGLSKYIENLPQGYETLLAERGTNLSGGQKQRLVIARELYKKPELLIFDEATSALDHQSEKIILNTLSKIKNDFTILLVTHRFEVASLADQIIVMNEGNLVEFGNFDELMKNKDGYFYELAKTSSI